MTRRALRLAAPALTLLLTPGCYTGLGEPSALTAGEGSAGEAGEGDGDGDDEGEDDGDDGADGDDDGADDGGEPPAPFDPSEPESYARKVKLLLTGEPLLPTELSLVMADPAELRSLVQDWTETEAFRVKMLDFFTVAFQQEEVTRTNIVSQLRGTDGAGNFFPRNELYANLTESFSRTAWNIVEQGRPFTEIATTRRWMMTTAVMSFLIAADDPPNSGPQHTFYNNNPPAGMSAGSSAAQQVANRAWYVPDGCVNPNYTTNRRFFVLPALMGHLEVSDCDPFENNAIMNNGDFSDWREVEITTVTSDAEKIPYYDIPTLRDSDSIGLEITRTGYFSTPAFLAKWRSNVDNSYRVTTNQTLIIGLGQSFDDEDATIPLDESGLSDDHAAPGTLCYACHSKLDPMRNFFMKEFDADFYSALDEVPDVIPSFGFFGHVMEGEDLTDLGEAVATHPFFPAAWAQKLCYLANSQQCDPEDPEFQRVVQHFVDTGYDFRELVIELFSSPLVTGAERTQTHDKFEFLVSITRRAHLCHTLDTRLQTSGVCNGNNNVANAVPEDAWSRGSATPFQPAASSLFYAASLESFCDKLGKNIVDEPDSVLQSSDMDAAVTFLVENLMDLSSEDSRNPIAREAIEQHVADARELTNNDRIVLESAFTLACTSPFVTSVGF